MLRLIAEEPDNRLHREAFARKIEEVEPAWAEFVRLQLEVGPLPVPGPEWAKHYLQFIDARELERQHGERWAPPALKDLGVTRVGYNRGFVELIEISAHDFLENAAEIYAEAPVFHLDLSSVKAVAEELFRSPHLRRIRSLDLRRNGLGDEEAALLANGGLPRLRWLGLGGNRIGLPGVRALVEATRSGRIPLRYVGLEGNPCDPRDKLDYDMDSIMGVEKTPDGRSLEMEGRVSWLHWELKDGQIQQMNRFALE